MSQDWTDDVYDKDAYTAHVIMSNIELMFATLKSSFSGTSAPSNQVAGQSWFDTTKKLQKYRDSTDTVWRGILAGTASLKLWLYLNAAEEGWAIDATVTDRVLALKGGSQAYNVSGGTNAGTWTQPSHQLVASEIPAHDHGASGDHTHDITGYESDGGSWSVASVQAGNSHSLPAAAQADGDHTHTSVGGDGAHDHGTTYRPSAAVGTLQYPDV